MSHPRGRRCRLNWRSSSCATATLSIAHHMQDAIGLVMIILTSERSISSLQRPGVLVQRACFRNLSALLAESWASCMHGRMYACMYQEADSPSPVEEGGDRGVEAVVGGRDVVDPGGEVSEP